MPSLLSISADQLRVCKLDYLIDGSKRTTSLFKGRAPRLRRLWLTNCVAIPSNAFPSLTNLAIELFANKFADSHYPFAELVAFLNGCPSLREVHLLCGSDVAFQVPPLPDVRSRDLVMPRLRKFSIIGCRVYSDASFHLAICSRLSPPPDCLFYMTPIPPTRLREVLDVVVASARRERPFTRLMVTQDVNVAKALDCISLQMVDSHNSMGIRVDVQMEAGFLNSVYRGASNQTDPPSKSRRLLCEALSNYPLLSEIQLLHLSGDDVHVLGGAWSTLLHSTFSSLASLVIVRPYSRDPMRLVVLECSHNADLAACIPCPQLQTLTIRVWPGTDLTLLPSLLASRAHAGYPLHQLSIVLMGAVFEYSIMEDVDVLNRLAEFVDVFDVHFGDRHLGVKGPLGPEPSPWSSLLPPECTRSEETPTLLWPEWS
ncbi:hypothetical protein C8Q74DRAFT_976866 [Fomes fomentarius]|nr:hypothetical protein C8Q74DRAFT_976866 [Fomes fomentarius]